MTSISRPSGQVPGKIAFSVSLVIKWLIGGLISFAAIWSITAVFTNNIWIEEWSPELRRNILVPGTVLREREEGWADSIVGRFGIIGSSEGEIDETPKVAIWGDSFVEAVNVADSDKMQRQLTELLRKDLGGVAVGIGERFASFADHRFRIPSYESALGGVRLHVLHLYSLEDTLPDLYRGARISLFLSEPDLHLEKYDNEYQEGEAPIEPSRLRTNLTKLHLQFFLYLRTRLVGIARLEGLRFAPGVHRQEKPDGLHRAWNRLIEPEWTREEAPEDAWNFLLDEVRSSTQLPVLIVYSPATPAVERGRVILENAEKSLATRFGELCEEKQIGFVSLEESFLRFWHETGRFPKGFQNSRPWEGHFNEDGHRLVAEAIHSWILENRHVVYPD